MAVDIGPKIGIDGEAEYRRQINQIITQSKTLSSQMRVVESAFTDETTAEEKAAAKSKVLTEQVSTQTERVRLLKDMLEKSSEKYGANSVETMKWQQAVNNAQTDLNKMEAELKKTQQGADDYGEEVDEATKETQEFDAAALALSKQQLAEFWGKVADATKKAATAAVSAAKELDKGYDTIVKKTGATGENLEELQGIAKNVYGSMAVEMSDVGSAVGEVATRLGLTGDELEETTRLFLQFAQVNGTDVSSSVDSVQKALAAFGLEAGDTARILDVMTAAGQDSGVGMNELASAMVKNAGALTELGMTAEQAIMFIGRLEKSGVDSETALSGMSRALKSATKQGIPLNEALENLEDTIVNGTESTDGLTTAYDLFGKSGDKIYNALKTGSISFKNLTQDVKNYSGVVTKTYEATISPWDKTKIAMNNLKQVGSELAGAALATLVPAIEKVTGVVQKVADWFSKLSPTGQKIVGIVTALGAGMAVLGPKVMTVVQTMSMLKTASLVAASAQGVQTAATGAEAAATGAATVAQKGLNAAMWANPVTWLVAGIAALTVAMVAFAASCDDVYKESEARRDEMNKATDAYNEQREAIIDEQDEVGRLTKRVQELQKKEELSTEEKAEMASAVKRLNDVYPDFNLQVDRASGKLVDETGAIIENTEALEKNFDSALALYNLKKDEERINAALDHYNEAKAIKEVAEAEIERLTAEKAYYEELAKHDDDGTYQQAIDDRRIALNAEYEAWADATVAMAMAENEYNALTENAEALKTATEETTAAVEKSTEATESSIPKWNELSDSQRQTAEKVAQAYRDMKDAVVKSLQEQMDMFEAFDKGEEITTETLLNNMQSQIDGVTEWERNLTTLADRGINQGLLQYLLEMGPKGSNYVRAFVNMSEPEFREANKKWQEALDIQGFTTELSKQLNAGMADVAGQMKVDGLNLGNAMARGITDAKAAVIAAAKDLGNSARTSVENVLQIQSPSKVFRYLGEMTGEGFQQGIEETMPSAANILSPWNDVGAFSGRGVNSIDYDALADAVRYGAENAQTKIVIGTKEFGRILRGMGVAMA